MTEPYTDKEINAAKELYLQGYGCRRVSLLMAEGGFKKPDMKTVHAWIKKYKWNDLRKKLHKKNDIRIVNTLSESRARQFEVTRLPQELALLKCKPVIEKLRAGRITIEEAEKRLKSIDGWQAIEGSMKHELLLFGEATERTEVRPVNIILPTWTKKENKDETKTEEAKG